MKTKRLYQVLLIIVSSVILLFFTEPTNAQTDIPPRTPVSSPIELSFEIACKDVATVQVVLDDEVKDIIARQIFTPDCGEKITQTVQTRLFFDTFERLTPAHLSVSAFDDKSRWIWMQSDDVVFTKSIKPMQYIIKSENPLSITLPSNGTDITNRQFQVQGSIKVGQPRSAYFELVSDNGLVLGSKLLYIPSSKKDGQWDFDFTFDITYPIYSGGARLTLQQYGVDIFGIESLSSVYLNLK